MTVDQPLPRRGQMPPRVLIAGGGVAALETLLALRSLAEERVAIELLAPERDFVYRPLAIAETFDLGEVHRFDVARIAADQGARHRLDSLSSIHPERHSVTTSGGVEIDYDALVVAAGARAREALPGAITFSGPAGANRARGVVDRACSGTVRRIVFAAPSGAAWILPLYELALMTAASLERSGVSDVELFLVTPEDRPLVLFGISASESVATLLDDRGIQVLTRRHPVRLEGGELVLTPVERMRVDCVVALPLLEGPHLPGLPTDDHGFITTDLHGVVDGFENIYAAGDATAFPVKQGGLATQQADAVAESLAARAGAELTPQPFRPVLRGLLLTGGRPSYLRAEISGGRGESAAADHALWWPPSKIAGRHLAPYLAARLDLAVSRPPKSGAIPVEVKFE